MGHYLDYLMDRAWDMGAPPVRSGRLPGTHRYWVAIEIPGYAIPVERHGESRDHAAAAILENELANVTAPEQQLAPR